MIVDLVAQLLVSDDKLQCSRSRPRGHRLRSRRRRLSRHPAGEHGRRSAARRLRRQIRCQKPRDPLRAPFRLISGISTLPSDPAETIHENLNRQAAVMIQIETVEAIDNLDAILTECPEIDCVWPGLLDLRVSMDLASPPNPGALEPDFVRAMAKFESILQKHDKPRSGLAMGPPAAQKKQAQNNSLSFLGVDALALRGLADIIPVARQMFPAERKMQDVKSEAPPPQVNGNGVAKDAKHEAAPLVNGHSDLKAVKQEAPLVNGHSDLKAAA